MRYPTRQKERTRERIVRAASRRFRSRGSEGSGIGTLMRDLDLTHGGFYRHFDSKEDLFVESFKEGSSQIHGMIDAAVRSAPPGRELEALIGAYLSVEHCENPGEGCPVATLATELARRPPRSKARLAFEEALKERTRKMSKYMPGESEEERVTRVRLLMSGMSGTLTVARVLTDPERRRVFLEEARKFYLQAARC